MALLKTYSIASMINGVIGSKLQKEIIAGNCATNIESVNTDGDELTIMGDAISNESALDAIVAAHDTTPPVVIPDVTARQISCALVMTGVSMAAIAGALESLPEPTRSIAKIEWEFSNAFERNRPLVAQMGQMLGKTSAELDALWLFAGTL